MNLSEQDRASILHIVKQSDIKHIVFDMDGVLIYTDSSSIRESLSFREKLTMGTFINLTI